MVPPDLLELSNHLVGLENELALVFNTASDIMVLMDARGVVRRINPAGLRMLKLPPGDEIGRRFHDWTHPEDVAITEKALAAGEVSPGMNLQNRWLDHEGKEHVLVWTISHQKNSMVAVGKEMTKFTFLFPHQLNLLNTALELAKDGVVITDNQAVDNPIIYANPSMRRITGYDRHELIGRNCRILAASEPQRARDTLRQYLKEGRGCTVLLRNKRKNGEHYFQHLTVTPVYNGVPSPLNYIGIQRDVSDEVESGHIKYAPEGLFGFELTV